MLSIFGSTDHNIQKFNHLSKKKKKKSGKENAFHIEELPNANGIYDRESW